MQSIGIAEMLGFTTFSMVLIILCPKGTVKTLRFPLFFTHFQKAARAPLGRAAIIAHRSYEPSPGGLI